MGERKGQNKYYPPDFDHNKHFSLNNYHGVHALRERGKKAKEGILIIRFEMPFNCWCLSCNEPIGMGVRYNSEKSKAGSFYSTPIFQFKMRCHLCKGEIIIQTDPEHFQYTIISGLRRREQRYTPEDAGVPELADSKTKEKLATDPMFQLEHIVKDEEATQITKPILKKILSKSIDRWDDYGINQIIRSKFREEKKMKVQKQKDLDALAETLGLKGGDVTLLPKAPEDSSVARNVLRNASCDVSSSAVEKRKKKLLHSLKSTITKKASKFNPFSVRHKKRKNKVHLNHSQKTSDLSSSLVSADYESSDENK